jgi:GxxExxY protein
MEVHTVLGPGLLESAYEDAFCYELNERGISFERQPMVSMNYKKIRIERVFRPDIVVGDALIVELKSIEKLMPIHDGTVRNFVCEVIS